MNTKKQLEKIEKINKRFLERINMDDDGNIWVVGGNTFEIKDELKKEGARFNPVLGWHFKEDNPNYDCAKINIRDITNIEEVNKDGIGWIEYNPDARNVVKSALKKFEKPSTSEFVGEIGKKILLLTTLKRSYTFDGSFGLTEVLTFEDEDGNTIVWMTSPGKDFVVGHHYKLYGTVKAHTEYHGDKQTRINRCYYEEINL